MRLNRSISSTLEAGLVRVKPLEVTVHRGKRLAACRQRACCLSSGCSRRGAPNSGSHHQVRWLSLLLTRRARAKLCPKGPGPSELTRALSLGESSDFVRAAPGLRCRLATATSRILGLDLYCRGGPGSGWYAAPAGSGLGPVQSFQTRRLRGRGAPLPSGRHGDCRQSPTARRRCRPTGSLGSGVGADLP